MAEACPLVPTAPLEAGKALASAVLEGGAGARGAARFIAKDFCPSGRAPPCLQLLA